MPPQKPLSLLDQQPRAVSTTLQDLFEGRELPHVKSPKPLFDTVQLALALVMLAVMAALTYVSELDNLYWTNTRITSFVQRALGMRRPPAGASAASARRLIVVAEPDESQRLIAKTTLERYGYSVALADNGAQAEALVRQAGPRTALVVLDREALRDSTPDTIQQLKRIQPNVRILMSEAAGGKSAVAAGAAGSIERPFSSMPLAEAVQKVLAAK
jgi:CheY-like chemotaxis protein